MGKHFTILFLLFFGFLNLYSQCNPYAKVLEKQPKDFGPDYKTNNENDGSQTVPYMRNRVHLISSHKSSKFGERQQIIYQYYNDTGWVQLPEIVTNGYNYGLIFWGKRVLVYGRYYGNVGNMTLKPGQPNNILEYVNGKWDTLSGSYTNYDHYEYFATDTDLFCMKDNLSNNKRNLLIYDKQAGKFKYLATIEFNPGFQRMIRAGKNRLLIPHAISIDSIPCKGFAYYENGNFHLNSDTRFNDSFEITIDQYSDTIYAIRWYGRNELRIFANAWVETRKLNSSAKGNGEYGFGAYRGTFYFDSPDYTNGERIVNVLCPNSSDWKYCYGPPSNNSVTGWAIKNNISDGYYLYDQDNGKVLKITEGYSVNGKIYLDRDSNCIYTPGLDSACRQCMFKMVSDAYSSYGYTDDFGNYTCSGPAGTYTLKGPATSSSCQSKLQLNANNIQKDIFIKVPSYYNIKSRWIGSNNFRWNSTEKVGLLFYNLGRKTDSIYFEIRLEKGISGKNLNTSIFQTINGEILKGRLSSLEFIENKLISIELGMDTALIKPGKEIRLTVKAWVKGIEKDTSDNSDTLYKDIVYSYDPNYKSPSRKSIKRDAAETITYFIEFQNEGTSYAEDVKVIDRIPEAFEIQSLNILSSKHPFRAEINNTNLVFYFDDIMLTPKAQNEENSKGYICFEITTNKMRNTDSIIYNYADIFFDLNPFISTNISEIRTDTIKHASSIETISNSNRIIVYPNPLKDILHVQYKAWQFIHQTVLVYDMQGRIIARQELINNACTIACSDWSSGVYMLQVNGEWVRFVKE